MAISKNNTKIVISGDAKGAQKALASVSKAADKMSKATVKAFKAAAVGAGIFEAATLAVGKSVIDTSAMFERFNVQLETIEGSSAKAQKSMDWITQFAAKTPFELKQVTDAFVQMKAFGIDPIANDTLRVLGDTASAMGRTLDQAVQAFADAATGEFERLKEFGIKARTVGNQVTFNWQQNGKAMSASADKNSQKMIQATLRGIWNGKYKGGMEKMSSTWDGMVSNMGDAWTVFQNDIGKAGAFDAAKAVLKSLMDSMQGTGKETKKLAKDISDGLVNGMQYGIEAIGLLAEALVNIPKGVRLAALVIDSFKLVLAEMGLVANNVGIALASLVPGDAGDKMVTKLEQNAAALKAARDAFLAEGSADLTKYENAAKLAAEGTAKINRAMQAIQQKIKDAKHEAEQTITPEIDPEPAKLAIRQIVTEVNGLRKVLVEVTNAVPAQAPQQVQGSRATGGMIPRDGYYMMHAGERVVSNSQSFGDINISVPGGQVGGNINWRDVVRNQIMPELALVQQR